MFRLLSASDYQIEKLMQQKTYATLEYSIKKDDSLHVFWVKGVEFNCDALIQILNAKW